jgi:hypothetical protein
MSNTKEISAIVATVDIEEKLYEKLQEIIKNDTITIW